MKPIAILMANGTEECEALLVVDLLRRAAIPIHLLSIEATSAITSSHNIVIQTDARLQDSRPDDYSGVILPGGLPGTERLRVQPLVKAFVMAIAQQNGLIAAICAAPTVLADYGLLSRQAATCAPGFRNQLTGALVQARSVVVAENGIITANGLGSAIPFALTIIERCLGEAAASDIALKICYPPAW